MQVSCAKKAAELVFLGADDEIRTRDPHLGKVVVTVRPVRFLFRPVRTPIYHHTRAMRGSACLADDRVAATDRLGDGPDLCSTCALPSATLQDVADVVGSAVGWVEGGAAFDELGEFQFEGGELSLPFADVGEFVG